MGVSSRLGDTAGLLRPISTQAMFSEPGRPAAKVSDVRVLATRDAAPDAGEMGQMQEVEAEAATWAESNRDARWQRPAADYRTKTGVPWLLGHRFQTVWFGEIFASFLNY